jgi:membrane protease YdiL (CAAX protease family)
LSLFTIAVYLTLGVLEVPGGGPLRPHSVSVWSIAGNLFSNFYEEFIFRGFLLQVALSACGRKDVAVAVTSVAFALSHSQYPWALQALVAGTGVALALLVLRTRSVWTAWIAHDVVDLVVDPLL